MFKEKKKVKKYGRKISCPHCKQVIYIDSEDEKDNIVSQSGVMVYMCFCGNEFVIDK